ncbi:four helix bundle protein [Rhodopirellula halodulae]|uniref:four helix bundle protein n=1 Tax=Rhodopirellula halodulae TaxID=2894198 RepID=UPI001E286130|nr:four helix bundle protein [Rhodopirellula sp. JC737]MCC9657342.1 four helix bundle protein [Rhodopirellula sp. JC737]
MEIWRRGVAVGRRLCRVADCLEERRQYRFAEQLRAAALSISNNIAEGSGAFSNRDFANFIAIAHKSTYECASMLLFFCEDGLIEKNLIEDLLDELNQQTKMQFVFRKRLLQQSPNTPVIKEDAGIYDFSQSSQLD